MNYLFIFLLSVLFYTTTCAQSFEGRIHLARIVGTDTAYYQYYVKEPNIRIEELDNKGRIQGFLVMNMLSNKIFAVNPNNKMWMVYENKVKTEVTGNVECARTGNFKNIAGKLCELWAVTNAKEQTTIDYWVAQGNFNFFVPHLQALNRKEKLANYFITLPNTDGCIPLEAYQHSKDAGNKNAPNQIIRTIKVEEKIVDIKLFKVPNMYRKYESEVASF
jgi:hypothetical protein